MGANATNIFLVPCDSKNFDQTLESPITLDSYPDHPSDLPDTAELRLWGLEATDNHRTYFEKMQPGDIVLFYRDDEYVGAGELGVAFEDTQNWASTTLWDDAPMTLVFTVDNFERTAIPKAAINEIFDYSTGYTPRGLTRIADNRVTHEPQIIRRAITKFNVAHPA